MILSKIKESLRFAFRHVPLDPVNNWMAKATTPDELIAAHIIQSMATDFEAWDQEYCLSSDGVRMDRWSLDSHDSNLAYHAQSKYWIIQRGPELKFSFRLICGQEKKNSSWVWKRAYEYFRVNEVEFSPSCGLKIIEAFLRLKKEYKTVQAVAAKAKADMEANEKKWNLAENLLGMKRNEMGALVPTVVMEE